MKKIISCIGLTMFLCVAICKAEDGSVYVLGGCIDTALAIWGFSTGGSSYVVVSASLFLVRGIVKIASGLLQ